jgi:hypothetical protein
MLKSCPARASSSLPLSIGSTANSGRASVVPRRRRSVRSIRSITWDPPIVSALTIHHAIKRNEALKRRFRSVSSWPTHPVGLRLSISSNQSTQRREKQNTPAPISEPDQQTLSDQDSGDTHLASSSLQARFTRRRTPSALRHQRIEIGARLAAEIRAVHGQEIGGALSALHLKHLEEFPFGVEL